MRDKRRNRFALPIGRAGRVALIGMVGLIGVAAASGQGSANADGKQLLREAHAKSQSAKTLQQYAEVIDLCRLAAERPLSENLVEYARNLRAWAHNQRGEYYAEQAAALGQAGQQDAAGQMDKLALAEFVNAIELNPDYWKAIHNRGVGRALAGRLDEAAADFSRAIGLKPDYANSWFNRGEIHSAQGKFDAAIADYTRAVQLDDRDADTRLRRGYAYFQTGQFSQALADYDRAIELAPGNVEALVHRAEANRSLGRWQRAADDYLHAMRIDSGYGPAYRGAAWLMATCPEAEIRNADMALRAAQQALQLLGHDDHLALDALAAALANDGQFGKARTAATQAIQAAPKEHAAPLQRRLALYQKNQPYREQVPDADRQ